MASTELMVAARDPIARRVAFLRSRSARYDALMPEGAVILNPKYHRSNHAQMLLSAAGDGDSAAAAASSANEGNRAAPAQKRKRPANCDDDDPLFNDEDDVLSRYVPQLAWARVAPPGCGLQNTMNTCFLNSVLQCFSYAPAVAQYLSTVTSGGATALQERHADGTLDWLTILSSTINRMRATPASKYIAPKSILANLRKLSSHFVLGRHCDAQEFAGAIVDAAQMSCLRRMVGKDRKVSLRTQHTTPLMRVLGGFTVSQLAWSAQQEVSQLRRVGHLSAAKDLEIECRANKTATLFSNTYEPFTMTHVPVSGPTLEDCLAAYCTDERIDGKIYQTPRKVGVDIKKRFMFHQLPPVLVLHLKRFNNRGAKLGKKVRFGTTLDMAPFCSENGRAVMCEDGGSSGEILFELTGVVVHHGASITYGHYVAFVKASSGTWLMADDEQITTVGLDAVLRAEAYMLFYSRATTSNGIKHGAASGRSPVLPPAATPLDDTSAARTPRQEQLGKVLGDDEVRAALAARRGPTARAENGPVAAPVPNSPRGAPAAAPAAVAVAATTVVVLPQRRASSDDSDSGDGGGGGGGGGDDEAYSEPLPAAIAPAQKAKRGERQRRFAFPTAEEEKAARMAEAAVGEFLAEQRAGASVLAAVTGSGAAQGSLTRPTRDDEYNASLDRGRQKKMHRRGYEHYQGLLSGRNVFQEVAEKKRSGDFVEPKARAQLEDATEGREVRRGGGRDREVGGMGRHGRGGNDVVRRGSQKRADGSHREQRVGPHTERRHGGVAQSRNSW